jgi:hypothetical protein
MEIQNNTPQFPRTPDDLPQPSAEFGKVPYPSEDFRTVPKPSEAFRNAPNSSESFGMVPNTSEGFRASRKESHTITVRDAARMFEQAGVARTERSIVNWCRRDAIGSARLDAYFDPNERRYYITEESIQRTITEEKEKAFRNGNNLSEDLRKRNGGGPVASVSSSASGRESPGRAVDEEIRDLQILNKLKDRQIDLLTEERKEFFREMLNGRQRIGQLEERLLQLGAPSETRKFASEILPNDSE